jgi:ABC-2 type transport system permease protein
MMGLTVLLRKELREQIRTSRMIAVGAVFVLFGVLGPLTDRYMKELFDALGAATASSGMSIQLPPPSLEGAATQILKNLSQFGIICALLLAMGTVAWEKERGTAGLILTKPASRAAFLGAKLIAISLTLAVAVALGCGLGYLYTVLLYPEAFPIVGFVEMCVLLWWMLVIFAAITMLGSTVTRSAVAAAGIGLVALLVLGILAALPVIGPYMPSELGAVAMRLCLGRDPGDFLGPLLFNIALVPALFALTWLVFRRQEL